MDSTGIPHLQANYNHWRPYGAYQQEDQFSDGTIRLIGLLWALLEGDTLLLLEEPELSLNTAIVEKIPGIISQLLNSRKKNSQIFISTHSSDILSDKGIGGKEVLLLDPTTNGTQVILAASKATVNDLLRNGFSIAEAVLPMTKPNNLEQLSFFNGE
jgi:predicted ATPase